MVASLALGPHRVAAACRRGFLNRIRKSAWVLEGPTESIREFFVDVPGSFSSAGFDGVARGFLDGIE
eukprot:2536439-Pyramimonas_sp.AAC.1